MLLAWSLSCTGPDDWPPFVQTAVVPYSDEEALADLNAFQREYENDNSWEQLQEDEYGHLRPLVSSSLIYLATHGSCKQSTAPAGCHYVCWHPNRASCYETCS